jgi:hypothetical protein
MFRAQDLGMLLTGIVAQAREGRKEWNRFAGPLFSFLKDRYHGESGLFFDAPSGFRRRFASFATQIYLSIACHHYGEFAGNPAAIAMASACAMKLIELQGPPGSLMPEPAASSTSTRFTRSTSTGWLPLSWSARSVTAFAEPGL